MLLQASHIDKSFGAESVLEDVNIAIKEKERVGLVGANGAGKTTLLKILTGQLEQDRGQVIKAKGVTVGYLAQNDALDSEATVWEEMLSGFSHLLEQEQLLRELELRMGDPAVTANPKEFARVSRSYADLADQFRLAGGYTFRSTIRGVLYGLKFIDHDFNTRVSTLSGGQKTRFALARLLTRQPNLLILDEPTNYLDMESVAWLERHLQSYQGGLLLVSHDRYFLDNLVSVIYELEHCTLCRYPGNYSQFLHLKTVKMEQQLKEYKRFREEKEKLQQFVQKNITRASTSGRAKAKQKQLQKLQQVNAPLVEDLQAKINLNVTRSSGDKVLSAVDLAVGYDGCAIARDINFDIHRGERVALLGPNGTGKTTLLKTLAGRLFPVAGSCREGHNVLTAYHDQEQEELSGSKTVLSELWDEFPGMKEQQARTILGRFLFSEEEVFKAVADLSGGEKARLALAKLMCRQANFLLLDEPTNHLDVYAKEALEEALLNYPGTLLFVSHDRYFLNKIASRIIELTNEGVTDFPGDYQNYLQKKAAYTAEVKSEVPSGINDAHTAVGKDKIEYLRQKEEQREQRKRRRRLQELERLVPETEEKITALEGELCQPEVYNDYQTSRQKNEDLNRLRQQLDAYLEEWLELEQ